ncbi:Sorting nexin 2A [Morus notabilis]|uniref:Sorting nexin 2A n=1 Tax=Morus notabilis TaxID=981085 RepID=W9QLS4_9ROSA|nr:sorting nexin 2A [Morus notabilis]EXB25846.1 Sorting nexin 2A [Morus notabilis]
MMKYENQDDGDAGLHESQDEMESLPLDEPSVVSGGATPTPGREPTGRTTFYTYLITMRTNIQGFGGSEFIVRRRFRDVVALSERLSETHRGFFVPVRPDKSVVESQMMQSEQFVEQRRAQVEKYLNKLAAHPVIRRSEELRAFLITRGRVLQLPKSVDVSPKQPSVVAAEGRTGGDLMRMFKELRQSVVNDWGRVKPLVVEEDKEFLERKEWLLEFEQQLSNLSQQAEALVKAQQDIGETMGELGLAFVKLTKFETDEAVFNSQRVRAADMKNVATAAVKSGRLYRELNSQTVKHLDKLHDYLGVMLAANTAFSDRSSALLTVQTLSTELTSLKSRIEKLEAASSKIFGGDRSRMRKIEELKETVRLTEDAKSSAVREYEGIKEHNRSELERLDKERHDDFMCMLRAFVLNQAGYAEKMANVWEKLTEETGEYAREGKSVNF